MWSLIFVLLNTFKTISKAAEALYKDTGSKFYAFAFPVSDEEDVKERLADLRKKHHDARHHCYAYVLGADKSNYRYNDDGEPGNSAGPPIHGQIVAFDLTNVLVVVVRYFGGTKLGVGGLISAYKTSAKEALKQARIITQVLKLIYEMEYEYDQTGAVKRLLEQHDSEILKEAFGASCLVRFNIPLSSDKSLLSQLELMNLVPKYIKTT